MKRKIFTSLVLTCALAVTAGLAGCSSSPSGSISNEYVEIAQYKGLEVKTVDKVEVTDEMVESTIQTNLESSITYEKVDRAAKDGDKVIMDYEGKVDGVAFDGGSQEDGELVLGSGSFIGANGDCKGFEEQIVGHKAGEKFDITVQFPEEYYEELAGKVAVFTINLKEVQESNDPELTDEVVAELSATATTVDEYRAEIKKQLEEENEKTYNDTLQSEVATALLDNTSIKGDALKTEIQEAYDEQYSQYESYAQMYGVSVADLCAQMNMNEEDLKNDLMEGAEKSVKFRYACALIAEKEGLKLSDNEFKEEVTALAEEYGFTEMEDSEESTGESTAKSVYDQFIEQYGEDTVRDYFIEKKVMEFLADNCVQSDNPATYSTEETTEAAVESDTEAVEEATTEAK